MVNKYGWIMESANVYTQGIYYEKNHALIAKKIGKKWNVIFRNTWTGEEVRLTTVSSVVKARKFMQEYMARHPISGW